MRQYGPQASIIVPCFNRSLLVASAIESALEQSDNSEVIVVDDGSTDSSWDVIQSFGDRVRSFKQQNCGVSSARNRGLREVRGKYVKFLDSDDVMPEGSLDSALKLASDMPSHIITFGDAYDIDELGVAQTGRKYGFSDFPKYVEVPRALLLSRTMSPSLPLYPADALRAINGFNEHLFVGEDQELSIRILLKGYKFMRVPCEVAAVREHSGPRLTQKKDLFYDNLICTYDSIVNEIQASQSPLEAVEGVHLARTMWIAGRDAARHGHCQQAQRLFDAATSICGRQCRPRHLSLFYNFVDPCNFEKILEAIKARLSKPFSNNN